MSKNRNYHKKATVAKDRFVGIRLDRESFSKIEEAAMAAGLTATQTVAGDELRGGAQSETQRVSEQNAGGASADYIPDEEIPWDFLNP